MVKDRTSIRKEGAILLKILTITTLYMEKKVVYKNSWEYPMAI